MQGVNDAELSAKVAAGVEKVKALEKEAGWKAVGNQPCEKFTIERGYHVVAKGIYTAPFPLQTVMAFLDSESMLKLFTRTLEFKPLYEKKDEFAISYTRYTMDNFPPREFVVLTGGGQDGNRVIINSVSVDYPCPQVEGTVRGDVIVGSFILDPIDETHTKIIYLS